MEILVPKISNVQDNANHYTGVIAYGTGADGLAYVLKIYPENSNDEFNNVFVILEANQTIVKTVFNPDDEMGDGLVFSWYDEAIEGFENFLTSFCLVYRNLSGFSSYK